MNEPAFAKASADNVGVIGFEPIQSETPDLQSGPALPLRRTPGEESFQNRFTHYAKRKHFAFDPIEGFELLQPNFTA